MTYALRGPNLPRVLTYKCKFILESELVAAVVQSEIYITTLNH